MRTSTSLHGRVVVWSCAAVGLLTIVGAGPALGGPHFLMDTEAQWQEGLMMGKVRAVEPTEWSQYMSQWAAFLQEGSPYPTNTFVYPELYVWGGGGGGGANPEDAGLVMVWHASPSTQQYSSAWKYNYQLDPDLSNCTIRVTVTAPQFNAQGSQINVVSFGIRDGAGLIRAWYWKVGPGNPIQWNVKTQITINTAMVGLNATSPAASGYASNPGFNIVNSQWLIVDENARWLGGVGVPPPGQQLPGMWNYWHDLLVTPRPPWKPPDPVKWSQPPVPPDMPYPPEPPMFWGWDEYSEYYRGPIAADDWFCTDRRPVTDIHWWGSFIGWDQPYPPLLPKAFHIGIWTDTPRGPQEPFSHPNQLVWQTFCYNYMWNFAGYDIDPRHQTVNEACFQFNQYLNREEWFNQEPDPTGEGRIYWLSIAAMYDDVMPLYPWGWKTRPHFFQDDAVRIMQTGPTWPPPLFAQYTFGQPIEWQGVSWDLAFELTTVEQPLEPDWGDAPDPTYPTLALSNGANHTIAPGVKLGNQIDGEPNGLPDPNALGDDNNNLDDEDGVAFTSALIVGQVATVDVTASVAGTLWAWIDFNADGGWAEAVDQIFAGQPLNAGVNSLSFPVPLAATPGSTFARFRYTTLTGVVLSYDGPAPDGEVEDYEVQIVEELPPNSKWIQLPDLTPNGINIRMDDSDGLWRTLADDFLCYRTSLLTDVHLWYSWRDDRQGQILSVHLSIHSDDPVGPDGSDPENYYSKPDQLLWQLDVPQHMVSSNPYAEVEPGEYWWDPVTGELIPAGDKQVWKMDIRIDPTQAFRQEGTSDQPVVYWLDVRVKTQDGQLGWKTRRWPDHFNDDAVLAVGSELPLFWQELRYPPGHPYHGMEMDSIDLAFVLTFEEAPPEPKHELGDAPDSTNTFGVAMTAYPKGGPMGVQANYPTVYQAGSPPFGPLHLSPRTIAYLGNWVSREDEADVGPDDDPTNNIIPPNNAPDLDLWDDGPSFPLSLPHCAPTSFQYTITVVNPPPVSMPMYVNVWFDWNRDGDWDDSHTCVQPNDAPEWAVQNQALWFPPGTYTVTTPTFLPWHPVNADLPDPIWMRITLSDRRWSPLAGARGHGGSGPQGGYDYGETEDFYLTDYRVPELDYGDAPDPTYPTVLTSDGARHIIVPGIRLGNQIDGEHDGQPDPGALGDDNNNLDDEDGVALATLLVPGQQATVNVTASVAGALWAWIDFGADGGWAEAGDQIFAGQALVAGLNLLNFPVPAGATPGPTFARFRFITGPVINVSYTGLASDGEVEDYKVQIEQPPPTADLGDAPDSSNSFLPGVFMTAYPKGGPPGILAMYPTVFQIGSPPFGPKHWNPQAWAFLGQGVTLENEADIGPDQDPTNNLIPLNDAPDRDLKDDGVTVPLALFHCQPTTFKFKVTFVAPPPAPLFVNVWFDWNRDGDWNDKLSCFQLNDAPEWAVPNMPVGAPGPGMVTFVTTPFLPWHPPGAPLGPIWMRITLAEQPWPAAGGGLDGGDGPPQGYHVGETEDYYFTPDNKAPTLILARSRKSHGAAGTFNINLPLAPPAAAGVEHRKGGPTRVILSFSELIQPTDGAWTPDQEVTTQVNGMPVLGLITNLFVPTPPGDQLWVDLANVPDIICLRLILAGVEDLAGNALAGDNDVHVVVLFGDVNGDYVTNIVDLAAVKANLFKPVDSVTFRSDPNIDGVINIVDLSDVKMNLFHQKQCP